MGTPPLGVRWTLGDASGCGFEALEALREEWVALWERCPEASAFQRPEWLLPWCRHYPHGELRVLALRREGRLVGLAPLHCWGDGERRVLSPLGSGSSDYLDVLLEPAHVAEGTAALTGWLARERKAWDRCEWSELRPGSPLLTLRPPDGCEAEEEVQDVCPMLSLGSLTDFPHGCVPARMLASLRTARRRAEAVGPVRFEAATRHTVDAWMEALFTLHAARWRARGEEGVLGEASVQAFHREVAHGFLACGRLALFGLTLRGQVAAVVYGFFDHAALRLYLSGFDPALARVSAGGLVLLHAMEEAARCGVGTFDFLRGREPYKYTWGARDRPIHRRRLWWSAQEVSASSVGLRRGGGGHAHPGPQG